MLDEFKLRIKDSNGQLYDYIMEMPEDKFMELYENFTSIDDEFDKKINDLLVQRWAPKIKYPVKRKKREP